MSKKALLILVSICLFIGAAVLFFLPAKSAQSCAEWKNIPFENAVAVGELQPTPGQLVVATRPVTLTPELGGPDWTMFFYKFMALAREIDRVDGTNIVALIESAKLSADFIGTDEGFTEAVAQFIVSDDGSAQIVVSTVYISRMATAYDIVYLEEAIRHEFEHYIQWKKATGGEHDLFTTDNGTRRSEEQCRWLWEHEYEAWKAGCDYFLRFDVGFRENSSFICRARGNDAAFRQLLYRAYVRMRPECTRIYAELSDHPSGVECTP